MRDECSFPGCEREMYGSKLCRAHANQLYRGRNLQPLSAKAFTPDERIRMNTSRSGSCLLWTGKVSNYGYPIIRVKGKKMLAHRFVYESNFSPIPPDIFVDHQCGNTRCLEPTHLRLATPGLNMQNRRRVASNSGYARGVSQDKRTGRWRARVTVNGKTHCFGTFSTPQEAEASAIAGRMELHEYNSIDRGLRASDYFMPESDQEVDCGDTDL